MNAGRTCLLTTSLTALGICLLTAQPVLAETPELLIRIKDHKFEPATLDVPVNTKVKLIVKNEDPTPEEFESDDLKREKVVAGNSSITIIVGPLAAGEYAFEGEFNAKTAQGKLIVK